MKIYKEKISNELRDEILGFLEENDEIIIDYWSWRKAMELHRLANIEIRKSVASFGKEFDSIIEYYQDNHIDNSFSYRELQLINEVNNRFKSLYSRYVENIEIKKLLKQLSSKKYNM